MTKNRENYFKNKQPACTLYIVIRKIAMTKSFLSFFLTK